MVLVHWANSQTTCHVLFTPLSIFAMLVIMYVKQYYHGYQ